MVAKLLRSLKRSYEDRVLPRIIDHVMDSSEMRALRAEVCEGLFGEVIEIGFGSGPNTEFYPAEVSRVRAVDPAELGWDLATERVEASPVPIEFVGLDSQSLPVDDDHADDYGFEMADRVGALASIGNTPIVRLSKLVPPGAADVWVKLEAANPTGSYKDRMALSMIEGAEERGDLQPGDTVVEYTGGSTGSSLALVCAVKGYRLRIVTSNAFAAEKLQTIAAFGAELEIIDSPSGIHPDLIPSMQARAAEILAEDGGFATDQFHNRDALIGYRGIGTEAIAQIDDSIDAVCIYVGVGGCLVGTSEGVATRWPDPLRVAVEPTESAVLSGASPGTHRIEGGGVGFVPPHLQADEHGKMPYDEVLTVSTPESFAMARRAAVEEGIWTGPSGGANLVAAIRLAERLGEGSTVLTVQCDSGMKYLHGDLYA